MLTEASDDVIKIRQTTRHLIAFTILYYETDDDHRQASRTQRGKI